MKGGENLGKLLGSGRPCLGKGQGEEAEQRRIGIMGTRKWKKEKADEEEMEKKEEGVAGVAPAAPCSVQDLAGGDWAMPGFFHPPGSLNSPPDKTHLDPPYLYSRSGDVERAFDLRSQFGHGG